MPKLSRQIITQRYTTFEAVQKLLDSARFRNEKEALHHVWKTAREYHQPTGFHDKSFERAYQAFRHFKLSKDFHSYKTNTFEHDEFSEYHQ